MFESDMKSLEDMALEYARMKERRKGKGKNRGKPRGLDHNLHYLEYEEDGDEDGDLDQERPRGSAGIPRIAGNNIGSSTSSAAESLDTESFHGFSNR